MKRIALAVLAVLLAARAVAQEAPPPPPAYPGYPPPQPYPQPQGYPAPGYYASPSAHRHLGFFLRFDIGPAYVSSSASAGGIDAKIKGGGLDFSFNIGGAISENLILSGHFWGHTAFGPDVEIGGLTGTTPNDTSLSLSGFGPSFTYYWTPANVFLTVTPSFTRLTVDNGSGGGAGSTELGFGIFGSFGKEWWVSDHWGLGVAGQLAASSNKDKGTGAPTWGTGSVALVFSATYN